MIKSTCMFSRWILLSPKFREQVSMIQEDIRKILG